MKHGVFSIRMDG